MPLPHIFSNCINCNAEKPFLILNIDAQDSERKYSIIKLFCPECNKYTDIEVRDEK